MLLFRYSLDMRFRPDGCYRNFTISFKGIHGFVHSSAVLVQTVCHIRFFKRDYIRYVTYFMERSVKLVNQNNNATGKSISYQTLIVDLEHFSVNQITYKPCMNWHCWCNSNYGSAFQCFKFQYLVSDVGLESVRMSEANYPEGVRRVFLINGNISRALDFDYRSWFLIAMHFSAADLHHDFFDD